MANRRERSIAIKALHTLVTSAPRRLVGEAGEPHVVIFSDYQCPFCRRLDAELPTLQGLVPEIRVDLRHYPLPSHPYAEEAAAIAICAERMGRFRMIHAALFAVDWTSEEPLRALRDATEWSGSLGVCASEQDVLQRIDEEVELARRLGATGSPVIVVGDSVHSGYLPPRELASLVRRIVPGPQ